MMKNKSFRSNQLLWSFVMISMKIPHKTMHYVFVISAQEPVIIKVTKTMLELIIISILNKYI
jgi:hypothetical protein